MALVLADRVQETTTTTGTGSVTLGGAVAGYQTFAVVGNGNTCYYAIVDGSAWEVGIGTYSTSGPTLARTTVLSNSNGNTTPITLAAGTKSVFVTYPAGKSINLDASGNASPLGTVASGTWQGSTIGVGYGGTGVTASSGANSVVLRDANQNIAINRLNQGLLTTTASGGTTVLTVASAFNQALTGTGGHTYKLPDATTLSNTTAFQFNNNATGTLTITNNAGTTVGTIAPGGAAGIALLSNATTNGTWDVHAYIPENVTWGTNALALGTTVISGGTWNGGTIASGYGGTGLTTFTGANNALYSTSSSALAAGTLPLLAGGTGATTASGARTNFGATTVGANFFTLTNPGAITFPRMNADNTVSALNASDFRTAIGAGTGSGTVTGVTGTSPVASSGGTAPAISLSAAYGDTLNPYASKTAKYVLAAPNGASGVPSFRALVASDIPTLNQNTTGTAANVTGIVAVANGGTGTATPSLVAGSNITITGSFPNQTIAASGGCVPDATPTTEGIVYGKTQPPCAGSRVALGFQAGNTSQNCAAIAIGTCAGSNNQGSSAIAIGVNSGSSTQGSCAIAIGVAAGQNNQGTRAIAIGYTAGNCSQAPASIAIGDGVAAPNSGLYIAPIRNGSCAGGSPVGLGYCTSTKEIVYGVGSSVATPTTAGIVYGKTQNSCSGGRTALGYQAGNNCQSSCAVAIGRCAGTSSQGQCAIAIGKYAGFSYQSFRAVAIGSCAGNSNQASYSVAVGSGAGQSNQSGCSVAIGFGAAQNNQGGQSVAIGSGAGGMSQGGCSVAVGRYAGSNGQGSGSTAIGYSAGYNYQGSNAIAIGKNAGYNYQASCSIVIGNCLGASNVGLFINPIRSKCSAGGSPVGLGYCTASKEIVYGVGSSDATPTVAGSVFGRTTVWTCSGGGSGGKVALGFNAALNCQNNRAIAIGSCAAATSQGDAAISIGYWAGKTSQDYQSIAIGHYAGNYCQSTNSIAIGAFAGGYAQSCSSIAIGGSAGSCFQAYNAIAIGVNAGRQSQGYRTVAIGLCAGYQNQSFYGVAIGACAGRTNQGAYSIAIGRCAGRCSQPTNSIAINATSCSLNPSSSNAFFVKPIRNAVGAYVLYYSPGSGEITYG